MAQNTSNSAGVWGILGGNKGPYRAGSPAQESAQSESSGQPPSPRRSIASLFQRRGDQPPSRQTYADGVLTGLLMAREAASQIVGHETLARIDALIERVKAAQAGDDVQP